MSHKSAVFSVEPQSLKPLKVGITAMVYDPTQVKFRVLISSIFDAMNFQHFLEMLEIMLQILNSKIKNFFFLGYGML